MSLPYQIDIGQRVRAMPGEPVSGDACWVDVREQTVLLALVDGLGHGEGAALAAERCVASFTRHHGLGISDMLSMAHRDLRGTRGAVATVARIRPIERVVEIAGVGNTSAVLFRDSGGSSRQSPIVTPGVLGSAYRSTVVQRLPFELGDMLVLHSDGLRTRFDALGLRLNSAQLAAEELVSSHGKASDDASCIVARALSKETQLVSKAPPSSDRALERRVPLKHAADAQIAAHETRRFAAELGFGARVQWEIGIAAAELASNAVKYGLEGLLCLRRLQHPEPALVLEVTDRGAGMGAPPATAPGVSGGLGVGLVAVRRLMDEVDVRSVDGLGTRVTAKRLLGSPPRQLP